MPTKKHLSCGIIDMLTSQGLSIFIQIKRRSLQGKQECVLDATLYYCVKLTFSTWLFLVY